MIEFTSVKKAFGPKVVLDDVSFTIETGEIVFVIGKSGMGKSVLLKNIVGLIRPDSGSIKVDGKEVSGLTELEYFPVRKSCGMVFQLPALLDSLNTYDNLLFGIRAHGMSLDSIQDRLIQVLGLVGLGEQVLPLYPHELSFGMQKRVSLARTLVLEPEYLLYDEPTTGLDPVATRGVNNLIHSLSQKLKVTSIVVSHDMHCAVDIADRIFLLDDGKIVEKGTPKELMRSEHPIARTFMRDAWRRMDDWRFE